MLSPHHTLQRRQRLLDVMVERKFDAVVLSLSHHVYYFSGYWPFWQHHAALVVFADGRSWLAAGRAPVGELAVDAVEVFASNFIGTNRQEQPHVLADLLKRQLGAARRVGVDTSAVSSALRQAEAQRELDWIDPSLWQMRRAKDPDELQLMQKAIDCTRAMHERARQIIEPGVPEIRVFAELHHAAVEVAGEPLTALLGNDYACGVGGGPPRGSRRAEAGELYVLDLGPAYRGYFADNCRVVAVDRKPTDAQLRTASAIVQAVRAVERAARPGVRCAQLYQLVDQHLQQTLGTGMVHHVGHGVGLQPHEYPHLNPNWDDVLIEGEIFTVEPGVYSTELRGGIRLEDQFLVTADGVRNLTPWSMDLT